MILLGKNIKIREYITNTRPEWPTLHWNATTDNKRR